MNRRSFLQATGLSTAIGLMPQLGLAARVDTLILNDVLVDTSTSFGASFARAARSRRLTVTEAAAGLAGEGMGRWIPDRTALHPIAGVTGAEPLFVLERLGWDRNMRVAMRIEHRSNAVGDLEHRIAGPVRLVDDLARDLRRAGGDFPALVADALRRVPAGPAPQKTVIVATPAVAEDLEQPLFSYVIAGRNLGLSPYPSRFTA